MKTEDFAWFYPQGHAAHHEAGHPERPERVDAIQTAMQHMGWWDCYPKLPARPIPEGVLHRIHSPAYLNLLEMTCRRGGHLDADTYVTSASWQLAHQAAGGAIAIASAVWHGHARRGFALTRPPGHHACHGQGMGFCLLNNVALAAEFLLQAEGARRLAIVDLDLHHGNGTQDIFWNRDDVFYISTHQSPFYPGTGFLDETGAGEGVGCNANFPLPPGSGDQALQAVIQTLVLPLLARYEPEMILVSYGFDPHWADPLGQLNMSAAGLHLAIRQLADFSETACRGSLALFLEGGYNLDAAAACSVGVTAALLGQPFTDPLGASPYPESQAWLSMLARAVSMWEI